MRFPAQVGGIQVTVRAPAWEVELRGMCEWQLMSQMPSGAQSSRKAEPLDERCVPLVNFRDQNISDTITVSGDRPFRGTTAYLLVPFSQPQLSTDRRGISVHWRTRLGANFISMAIARTEVSLGKPTTKSTFLGSGRARSMFSRSFSAEYGGSAAFAVLPSGKFGLSRIPPSTTITMRSLGRH